MAYSSFAALLLPTASMSGRPTGCRLLALIQLPESHPSFLGPFFLSLLGVVLGWRGHGPELESRDEGQGVGQTGQGGSKHRLFLS